MNNLETIELQLDSGVWKILKRGDEICIVPFWKLFLRNGNQLVIKGTVSDGKPGVQEQVELVKQLDKKPDLLTAGVSYGQIIRDQENQR